MPAAFPGMDPRPKVAVVTGAGSGIGAAAAELLARNGIRVGLLGRSREPLESLAATLADFGGQALVLEADVAEDKAMSQAFAAVQERWGIVDMIVANAGINGVWAPLDQIQPDEWDTTFAVNVRGTYLTLRAGMPHLNPQGASIVIVTSVNGSRVFTNAGASAYASSKAAQLALAKMAALELAPRRVRVNAVCPGSIRTAIEESTERRGLEALSKLPQFTHHVIPLTDGQPGSAAQVAELIWFLLSDAASHISGTEVFIDGAESLP